MGRECAAAYQYTELFFSMKYEGKSVLMQGRGDNYGSINEVEDKQWAYI